MTLKIDKDVPDGTVLILGIGYEGVTQDKTFTYVALKVGGLWYLTGSGKVPQAAEWGAVERWLARDGRTLKWVHRAESWEVLWPVGDAIEAPASAPCPAGPSCYALDEPESPLGQVDEY